MKIVIAGGSGQLGGILTRAFLADQHQISILTRSNRAAERRNPQVIHWDGKAVGAWADELEAADVVINLAGRTVNCRYSPLNRRQIMDSRVESTRAIGHAISRCSKPPAIWLQSSTATIYAHRFDGSNDENGVIGGEEPYVPDTWRFSIDVAKAWEEAANEFQHLPTRIALMRTAMVMSPGQNGVFDVLMGLVRKGLGGTNGSGQQFVSWIHELDFIRAIHWLIDRQDLSGAVNIASPNPVTNRQFMSTLRIAASVRFGLPATRWMLEAGALLMKTETELILKSRRVTPGKLLESGFRFEFPNWDVAARDLYRRWRKT